MATPALGQDREDRMGSVRRRPDQLRAPDVPDTGGAAGDMMYLGTDGVPNWDEPPIGLPLGGTDVGEMATPDGAGGYTWLPASVSYSDLVLGALPHDHDFGVEPTYGYTGHILGANVSTSGTLTLQLADAGAQYTYITIPDTTTPVVDGVNSAAEITLPTITIPFGDVTFISLRIELWAQQINSTFYVQGLYADVDNDGMQHFWAQGIVKTGAVLSGPVLNGTTVLQYTLSRFNVI